MSLTHDRAAVISIGDELVLGQTLDTNSRWISERLVALGIPVVEHVTVPDDLSAQVGVLTRLSTRVPLVIVTGGLGPTLDDLTREALARATGDVLVEDAESLRRIESMFARRGRSMNELQRVQALRPSRAACIPNEHGTAPGLHVCTGSCDLFCLPGPPGEMRPMLEGWVRDRLAPPRGRVVRTHVLHTYGAGEGDLAARLGPLMERTRNPLVGTTASGGVVSVRVRYEGAESDAQATIVQTVADCRSACAPFVFGEGDDTLASVVVRELRIRGARLCVVESCTGGMLGEAVTEVPGASDVFVGGWISYDNGFKSGVVGVPGPLIEAHGAVSAQTADAMAEHGLQRAAALGATHALSITGVAGPGGGSEAKPVGTVFVACASEGRSETRRFRFTGDRAAIRDRSVKSALAMLRFALRGERVERLLWEEPG